MGSQELCRLCVAGAKCREMVLSWWIARLPLLYLITLLMGYGANRELLFILFFAGLSQELTRSLALKPIQYEDLSANPCKEEFSEASLTRS